MVVVAGRKPHVLNILGVSTGTLPVSVCLLPVPVSTLSCTPFHRSPTINSQRFALFDSTFSVRFKLISHSLSAPFPLPLRSADSEDVPTCLVCVCRRLPPSRSVAVCRPGGTPGSWVHFVSTQSGSFHPSRKSTFLEESWSGRFANVVLIFSQPRSRAGRDAGLRRRQNRAWRTRSA